MADRNMGDPKPERSKAKHSANMGVSFPSTGGGNPFGGMSRSKGGNVGTKDQYDDVIAGKPSRSTMSAPDENFKVWNGLAAAGYPVDALMAVSRAASDLSEEEPLPGPGKSISKNAPSFGMYYPEEWNQSGIAGLMQRAGNNGRPLGFELTDEIVNDLGMSHDTYDGESGRSLYDIALSNSRSLFGLPADIDRERLLYEQILNAEPGETASWAGVPLTPFSAQKNDLPYRIRQNVGLSNGTLPGDETSIPVLLDNNRIANLADEKTRQTFAQQGSNGRRKGAVDWKEPRPWPKVY